MLQNWLIGPYLEYPLTLAPYRKVLKNQILKNTSPVNMP